MVATAGPDDDIASTLPEAERRAVQPNFHGLSRLRASDADNPYRQPDSRRIDPEDSEALREQLSHEEGSAQQPADNNQPILKKPSDTAANNGGPARRSLRFLGRHKKAAAAGAGVGTAGILAVLAFLGLQPLRINFTMAGINAFYGASSAAAQGEMSTNLVDQYYRRVVLVRMIGKTPCFGVVSRDCVGGVTGKTSLAVAYRAWSDARLETKIADKFGIEFVRDKGQLYMRLGFGQALGRVSPADINALLDGNLNIYDLGEKLALGTGRKGEGAALRAAMNVALKDTTIWDRVYFRFRFGALLKRKYGIRLCMIACNIRDSFNDNVVLKIRTAKIRFYQWVVRPFSEELAGVLPCVLGSGGSECDTKLKQNSNGAAVDPEPTSPYGTQLTEELATAAADDTLKLAEADPLVEKVTQKGFANVIVERVLVNIFNLSADAASQVAAIGAKAIPIVGWVLLAAQLVSTADKAGPVLRVMAYATTAAAAVRLYMMYQTVDSEMQSGHVDNVELGSFATALNTNFSGSSSDQVDASTTPLYGAIMGGGSASTDYRCNDGSTVPAGKLVCPEERLDRGNGVADGLHSVVNFVPGIAGLAGIINKVNDLIGFLLKGAFDAGCAAVNSVPPGNGCTNAAKLAASHLQDLVSWFINTVVGSPFTENMSGGRTFDMLAAGADVSSNKACQVNLGCAALSNQQVADQRNQALQAEQAAFNNQPYLAKLFSTNTRFSLISQVAMTMPASVSAGVQQASAMLSNPFGTLAQMFSTIISGKRVFAATPPIDDPFGVTQYGYTADQIPADPVAYWDQHCQGDFTTAWFNGQAEDEKGEPVAHTPEPCLLIRTMTESMSGFFDPSTIPPELSTAQ